MIRKLPLLALAVIDCAEFKSSADCARSGLHQRRQAARGSYPAISTILRTGPGASLDEARGDLHEPYLGQRLVQIGAPPTR
jgi:hypothetical protein